MTCAVSRFKNIFENVQLLSVGVKRSVSGVALDCRLQTAEFRRVYLKSSLFCDVTYLLTYLLHGAESFLIS